MRFLKIGTLILAAFLFAVPVSATAINTVTFDDTAANDTVTASWQDAAPGGFTSVTILQAASCTGQVAPDAGFITCAETSPLSFKLTGPGTLGNGNNTINANLWENFVGGQLSDTLSIVGTQLDATTVQAVFTFQSDVDGGSAITALAGGTGITLLNLIETGQLQSGTLGQNGTNPTFVSVTSDAPVPEPGSLLLLGTGLLGAYRWRKRSRLAR